MTYRIHNGSCQDGQVYIQGTWTLVHPGQTVYTKISPGTYTQNLTITALIDNKVVGDVKGEPVHKVETQRKAEGEVK